METIKLRLILLGFAGLAAVCAALWFRGSAPSPAPVSPVTLLLQKNQAGSGVTRAEEEEETSQNPEPVADPIVAPKTRHSDQLGPNGIRVLMAQAVEATELVPATHGQEDLPQSMEQVVNRFSAEPDPETKEELLAFASQELAEAGQGMKPLLGLALQPGQPIEVQRQALYLATEIEPGFVQSAASNPNHCLQQDAEAFLLELRNR